MAGQVHLVPMWQRAMIALSTVVVGMVIIVGLQWGRPVLIPIALAILLTFLLNPIVKLLQKTGLRRPASVLIAVITAGLILVCLVWMVSRQVSNLVAEIPQNTNKITAKIKTLREWGTSPLADQFGQMADEIGKELHLPLSRKQSSAVVPTPDTPASVVGVNAAGETVVVHQDSIPWLTITGYLGSAMEVLATLAFSLVLLVFFLLGREDLRDRVVMLAGRARLALTSKALQEVTDRISRYILVVAIVNGGFGVLVSLGLFLLGVPYALLWGFLAGGLRFIPYVGAFLGALFPIAMSLATSDGWWQPISVFGFVVALELICGNVVEPLVFGHNIGVSPTALLISAAFWLYLWGPIGLVLSAPLAVCLVVLGKNVPQLNFLTLLLGDAPALQAHVGIYQRLILGDNREASRLITHRLKELPEESVYDCILIPALNFTRRDTQRGYLSDDHEGNVIEGVRQTIRDIKQIAENSKDVPDDTKIVNGEAPSKPNASPTPIVKPVKILGCIARDELDGVSLEMLRQLLDPIRWDLEIIPIETLTSELITRIQEQPPAVICIASLPPGGVAYAQYLCKRLRSASPETQIILGRWGQKRNVKFDKEKLERAGATFVTNSLLETRKYLEARFSILSNSEHRLHPHFKPKRRRKWNGEPLPVERLD